MTVSFHKYGDMFFPGTGDIKVCSTDKIYEYNI
jgi:acetoin utilization deacetylase AcuC-like enzyme